ncbi:MAG: signal transduction histidine kinase [Verrucomicrobiales bacterium]|jgi:signal transduction histidine kinase
MKDSPSPITEIFTRSVHTDGKTTRILLIEDNPADAKLAELYLNDGASHFDMELTWCSDLKKGVSAIAEQLYDIVLLDLSLPDSSGIDTFARLHKQAPKTPIVVLSGHEDEELAAEIVKRGGQDCLAKDMMSGPVIRRAVRHAIERKGIYEELRSMQMQLIQSEKMESIGRLAAGVAHEVKNPLAQILMGIDYLSTGIEPGDPNVPKILISMEHALQRADKIVRGLLDFSSDRKLGLVETDINALLEKALVLVEIRLKELSIELGKDFGQDIPNVKLDPVKMEQVLINIIFNAVQAIETAQAEGKQEGPGKISIQTRAAILSDAERDQGSRTGRQLRSGDQTVVIQILDNGPGIPDDKIEHIFDPFFTTKPTGTGTGLGLTVVKKIIDLHEGHINLSNRPDAGGAEAKITLKASNQPIEPV